MRVFALVLLVTAVLVGGCDSKVENPVSKPAEPPANVVYPKYDGHSLGFAGSITNVLVKYQFVKSNLANDNFYEAKTNAEDLFLQIEETHYASRRITPELRSRPDEVNMAWRRIIDILWVDSDALRKSRNIKEARRNFSYFSLGLIEGLKTFGHNLADHPQIVHCSMFFDFSNNAGGYWLEDNSRSPIRNPYFGKEMLECGEKKELLAGRPK